MSTLLIQYKKTTLKLGTKMTSQKMRCDLLSHLLCIILKNHFATAVHKML